MQSLLDKLRIKPVNSGACCGPDCWMEDTNGAEIISINPANEQALARVIAATGDTYEIIASAAHNSFQKWRTVPAPKRGELIRDLGNALRELKEPLGDLVTLEMGKIQSEGHGEVQEMIDICDFAAGLSRQLYGFTMHSERPGHRMYEQWHPLGPVGVITAFNFPVAVWSWNAAIAAVCGDTVIWKPSSTTPLTSIALQHIANDVMSDHGQTGVLNLVSGTGKLIGRRLLDDPRVPLISFTGSTNMGRQVSEVVASRFGRTILELGGNNAIVVSSKADIAMATHAILFGAVGTAGQRCTTTRRIIVHKSISAKLIDALIQAYKKVVIGNPLDNNVLMGPVVDKQAINDMLAALSQARQQGGKVLYGGNLLPDIGSLFVEPAIVKMPAQTKIVREETFAPILYLLEYGTMDEAIKIHNSVPQGLSSSIFTNDLLEAETFLSHVGSDCGIANVNIGTSGAEIGGAFGGEKETGGGRESGSDSWKGYMRRQTTTINWSTDLPLAQGVKFGD